MEIRKAKIEEAEEILKIYKSLIGYEGCLWDEYYPNIEIVNKDIKNETLYVALIDDEIVGAAQSGIDEELFNMEFFTKEKKNPRDLSRVAVKKEYQKQGIARKIIAYIEDELRKDGVDYMYLTVGKTNIKAYNLYKTIGYETKGEMIKFDIDLYCQEKKI